MIGLQWPCSSHNIHVHIPEGGVCLQKERHIPVHVGGVPTYHILGTFCIIVYMYMYCRECLLLLVFVNGSRCWQFPSVHPIQHYNLYMCLYMYNVMYMLVYAIKCVCVCVYTKGHPS